YLCHFGLSQRDADTAFQPRDGAVIESETRFVGIDHQRRPQREFAIRVLKFRRHHAENPVGTAIELNLLSKNRWVGSVPAFPQAVAQHGFVFNGSIFLCKHAPEHRTHTQHPKNTSCRSAAKNTFRLAVSSNVEILDILDHAELFENSVLASP